MVLDAGGLGDDTDGILDFIKDLPDINPVSAAAGGMFKSRSASNLSTLGALRWADLCWAGLGWAGPRLGCAVSHAGLHLVLCRKCHLPE